MEFSCAIRVAARAPAVSSRATKARTSGSVTRRPERRRGSCGAAAGPGAGVSGHRGVCPARREPEAVADEGSSTGPDPAAGSCVDVAPDSSTRWSPAEAGASADTAASPVAVAVTDGAVGWASVSSSRTTSRRAVGCSAARTAAAVLAASSMFSGTSVSSDAGGVAVAGTCEGAATASASARANCAASAKRSAGSLARAVRTTASRASETCGFRVDGTGGCSRTC